MEFVLLCEYIYFKLQWAWCVTFIAHCRKFSFHLFHKFMRCFSFVVLSSCPNQIWYICFIQLEVKQYLFLFFFFFWRRFLRKSPDWRKLNHIHPYMYDDSTIRKWHPVTTMFGRRLNIVIMWWHIVMNRNHAV